MSVGFIDNYCRDVPLATNTAKGSPLSAPSSLMLRFSKRAARASASWRLSLSSNPATGSLKLVDMATSQNTFSKYHALSGCVGCMNLRSGRPRATARALDFSCLCLASSICCAWKNSKSSLWCSTSCSVAGMTFMASVAAAMRTVHDCSLWAAWARRTMFSASGVKFNSGCLGRDKHLSHRFDWSKYHTCRTRRAR